MSSFIRSVRLSAVMAFPLFTAAAFGAQIPVGYLFYNVTIPTATASFGIVNSTNTSADVTAPVTTQVSFTPGSLSLSVLFSDSTTHVFNGLGDFTQALDLFSYDSKDIAVGGETPIPISAIFTATISPLSVMLFDSSTHTLASTVTGSISDVIPGGPLQDGDLGVIFAKDASTSSVPEPTSFLLVGAGLLIAGRRRLISGMSAILNSRSARVLGAVALFAVLLPSASFGAVTLYGASSPSTGVAGVTFVNVIGSGFPANVSPANVSASFAVTCGGPAVATAAVSTITLVGGTTLRLHVQLPASLSNKIYHVSLKDAADPTPFTSSNCSAVKVTHTNPTLSACLPTSSLGVLTPTNPGPVTAYVPNGAWSSANLGIQVVRVEGGGLPVSISTPSVTNSCSSNPATGQTVCVANNKDVYLLSGSAISTTLSSGSTGTADFSGGSCNNCGVAVDALNNRAVIAMGVSGSPSRTGVQVLNLNNNTFNPPVPLTRTVSEDIAIDPTRSLILSPGESGYYELLQTGAGGSVVEYEHFVGAGEFDTAATDCSTGIALAGIEFTNNIYITDLKQAVLTTGSPNTWTAPQQIIALDTAPYGGFSAGTSGMSVAPGSAHLAVVSGEFGGNVFAVMQLPSTSGTGTPDILDYAVAAIPAPPGTGGWSFGLDPHTITAYTSPNDGKAYGLFANSPAPSFLARVDLQCVLTAARTTAHGVTPGSADSCVSFFPTH